MKFRGTSWLRGAGTLALLIAFFAMVMIYPSQAFAKGYPWYLKVENNAVAAGNVSIVVNLDKGTSEAVTIPVTAGMTPAQKATAIANALDAKPSLKAEVVASVHVKIQVANNHAPDGQISSISMNDSGTGEGIHWWKDDPPPGMPPPIVEVYLDIDDAASGSGGNFYLGVGDVTPASFPTDFPALAIEVGLMAQFNALFPDYSVSHDGHAIRIQNIPCELGVKFGTDDPQLPYEFRMHRTNLVPSLTGWGLLVLAVLVVASGVWVVMKRRRIARVRA